LFFLDIEVELEYNLGKASGGKWSEMLNKPIMRKKEEGR